MHHAKMICCVQITLEVASGERLPVPSTFPCAPGEAVPGPWVQRYVALMRRCWEQAPAARPSFDQAVAELSGIIEEVQPGGAAAQPSPPAAVRSAAAASAMCCICMEHPPTAALLHRADKE